MVRPFLFLMGLVLGLTIGACGGAGPMHTVEVAAPAHVLMAPFLEVRTVALVGTDKEGEIHAYCSGVWVSPSVILTANHCVDDVMPGDVIGYVVRSDVFPPGSFVPRTEIRIHGAGLVGRDSEHDLALVRALHPPDHETAVLSAEVIAAGLPVQAMGQPLGMWWSYSSGEVAAVRVMENAMDTPMLLIQSTVPISGGSSGGGLFDQWGLLVGITHASFRGGQNMNLFIHAAYIRDLLDTARKVGAL